MIKQSLIIGIAAAGLLLSAQASAYEPGNSLVDRVTQPPNDPEHGQLGYQTT